MKLWRILATDITETCRRATSPSKIGLDKQHVGNSPGQVRAVPHRDAHRSGRKAAPSLIPSPTIITLRPAASRRWMIFSLFPGQHLGHEFCYASLMGNGPGRSLIIVACKHDYARNAKPAHCLDDFFGFWAQWISDNRHARGFSGFREKEQGMSHGAFAGDVLAKN